MKIFFARHGESQANLLHEISNRGLKHPLTQKGREQAIALAHKLEGQSIAHIYSSPVLRAIETSALIANDLGIEYEVTEALREYDLGELEGRSDEKTWEFWQELFDAWTQHGHRDRRAPGGENFYHVQNRFLPFINELVMQYRGTDINVLCISHGGLYWVMLPLILKNIDRQFIHDHPSFGYTDMVIAELRPQGLVCLQWGGFKVGT